MTDTSIGMRLEVERAFAIEAVAAASRLCRTVRDAFDPSEATPKADSSPVTVADLSAQALVSTALGEQFPDDGLMGEEDAGPLRASPELAAAVLARVQAQRPEIGMAELLIALDRCDDPGGPARRWWTLDPVDGTKGFLRNEQYAVALALIEDGEVVLAAMGSPNLPLQGEPGDPGATGCLFVAERGQGAYQIALADVAPGMTGQRIAVAELGSAAAGRYAESVESAHSNQSQSARIGEILGISAEPLRLDSQTKYAVVGRGDASIYLRLPRGDYRENVWDHAAGYLIVREAGGRVSDVEGKPLDFSTGTRMTANRGIVATAAAIHDVVLEAVVATLS